MASQEYRGLVLFLKKWFEAVDLYGSNAVNSYAISWLAIFYLQIKHVFPSVYELITMRNKSLLVGGWECGFLDKIPAKNEISFKKMLAGFFYFYTKFNYRTDVICPFLGKVLKKSHFLNVKSMPKEMSIYKNRLEKENLEFFRHDSPMCVQDPVDLSQNMTKGLTKSQLKQFRQYCKESFDKLGAKVK